MSRARKVGIYQQNSPGEIDLYPRCGRYEKQREKVTLLRRDGKKITFDIGNVPVLAIWSNNKMGKYACIEAWWGLPDTVDCDRELKNKFLINTLPAGKTFEYEVTVTF